MPDERKPDETPVQEAAHFSDEPTSGDVPAWEQIAAGRYMPRRIKGSCKGRALG
jgi:hypothetical protein